MTNTDILAARAQVAYERALEVIQGFGSSERTERLEVMHTPNTKNPVALSAYQADLMAALAEICADQERRIARLEKAGKAARKPAKK